MIEQTILIGYLVEEQGKLWQELMGSQGFKVVLTSAEVNILKFIDETITLPDLILIDIGLKIPNSNILQSSTVCRWCKENHPEIKVILTSSKEEQIRDLENRWALRQGAIALLPKLLASNLSATVGQIVKFLGCQLQKQPLENLIDSLVKSQSIPDLSDTRILAPVNPPSDVAIAQSWEGYLTKAKSLFEAGSYEEAKEALHLCIRANPSLKEAYLLRADSYLNLNQFQSALDDYDRAAKLDSKDAEAYWRRGNMYFRLGDSPSAIADFERAIKLNPKLGEAYCGRGLARFHAGDEQGAARDYDKSIQVSPKYAEAYNNRGILRSTLGNINAAARDFDQAIKLNPNYADAYYNRGNIHSDAGEWQKAIADYTETIKLNPDFALAYGNRGIAYYEIDNVKAAISDTQTAINIFRDRGDTASYKQALDTLKQMQ